MARFGNKFTHEVEPDEIFIDSSNLPSFDTDRFEGRIERALSKRILIIFALVCIVTALGYIGRIFYLQINKGESFATRSRDNSLDQVIIYAERGGISDNQGDLLVWNELDGTRAHKQIDGIAHVVGHLGFPTKEEVQAGVARDLNHQIGKDGVEQSYNHLLDGTPGVELIEHDAHGEDVSRSIQVFPRKGKNITLTIDAAVQERLYQEIKNTARERGFVGGSGGIMDIHTGEILALVSYPEYPLAFFSTSTPSSEREKLLKDPSTPFLDRAVSGLYTPGSIVKPIMAIAALAEKVITPEKGIVSTGSISIPNPYDKTKETIFRDWKAHGWVDMRHALAVSSDVYFYSVGGGYKDQPGIGITAINKYMRMFGLGSKTLIDLPNEASGDIPSPEWKAKHFDGEDWYVGDTYNTSIGQYGFQVTPLQMLRAIGAIATNGLLVRPHLVKPEEGTDISSWISRIELPKEYFEVAKEGMRLSVTEGTASGLNIDGYKIAAKTGTAELGIKKLQVNSWVTGFFPYNDPRYVFVVVMERGPLHNPIGATYVMRQVMDWMLVEKPEYTKPLIKVIN